MLKRQYSSPADGPTVAIHARGGDKHVEFDYSQWGYELNYTAGMEHLVRRYPKSRGGVCVIVSDDPVLGAKVSATAKRIIGCWRTVDLFGSERHEQDSFNTLPADARCKAAKQVVANIDALAQADYVLGEHARFSFLLSCMLIYVLEHGFYFI